MQVSLAGTLTNGKKFDSSRDRGQPFVFTIGMGQISVPNLLHITFDLRPRRV